MISETTSIPDKRHQEIQQQMDLLVQEDVTEKAEPLVYKRNELIHGHFNLSAMSLKVFDAILTNVDPYSNELHPVNLGQTEIARLLGISRQTLNESIDNIVSELLSIDLKVPYIQEDWEDAVRAEAIQSVREGRAPRKIVKPTDGKSWTYIKLFDRAPYNDSSRILTFAFHPRLHNYIAKLRGNYTYYQFKRIAKMGGKHSIRLYGILRSALSLSDVSRGITRAVKDIEYAELRKMLGIKDGSYKQFNKFCQGVLDKAKEELMDSDLIFSYSTPDRKGPKSPVKTIRFYLIANVSSEEVNGSDSLHADWEALFVKTFTEKAQKELKEQYSQSRISRNVKYLQSKISDPDHKPITSTKSWLRKAINEDYAGVAALTDGRFAEPNHKLFITNQLKEIWHTLDDITQDEFLEIGFESQVIDSLFSAYMVARERALKAKTEREKSKSEQRSKVSASLMDIEDTNW